MKFFRFLLLIALVFSVISCSDQNPKQDQTTEVVVLHTNDMHASIEGMSKLAAYKQSLEKKHEHVLLVSAGDIFSGNPVVDFHNKRGYPMVDLMNRLGYQASTMGNHEFDYGQEILKKRMKQADFPFICANMDTRQTSLPRPQPYVVLESGNIRIFFLGLLEIGHNGIPSTHPDKVKNIEFSDPVGAAQSYISQKDRYDAFIGLTHLGYDWDQELAQTVPQFDAILGGHSHTLVDTPKVVNGVLINQAGDDLNFVGQLNLTFQDGELINRSAKNIKLDQYNKADSTIAKLVDQYQNNEALNQVIGKAAAPIQGKEELGALFTDAQRKLHNLDFAFQNNGGIRIPEIPKGKIRIKTIYELDPFGNELVQFEMTPAEIKSLIRNASHHGHVDLQISGGSYTLRVHEQGEEVKVEGVVLRNQQGQPLNADSTYQVGLNSYIASSYEFDHHDEGESLYVTTAQNLIDFIKQQGTIDYSGVERVFTEKVN